ncbi:hypothetical protein [Bradyrhizobium sp. LTSPM299]|uniref:hypothetical protein n=1 Tax=Bradyrhizobium sp. LTSPM299 TaxID=1619233 RepID=UPI0012E12594|nr:hypothetical protein [Bradyrhizobium sp. LTSPM299]
MVDEIAVLVDQQAQISNMRQLVERIDDPVRRSACLLFTEEIEQCVRHLDRLLISAS